MGQVSGLPKTQLAYTFTVRTADHHIIRNSFYFFTVIINDFQPPIFPYLPDFSAETNPKNPVCTGHEPHVSTRQPIIRKLYLNTIHDFLLKQPIFVAYGKSGSRVGQLRQGIHKACCKSAQPSVSKTRIRFKFIQHIQIKSDRGQRFFVCLRKSQICQIGFKRSAYQKFHGQIVYLFGLHTVGLFFECLSLFCKNLQYRECGGLVNLLRCGFPWGTAEITGQLSGNIVFDFQHFFSIVHRKIILSVASIIFGTARHIRRQRHSRKNPAP